jgi:hypothetical protein
MHFTTFITAHGDPTVTAFQVTDIIRTETGIRRTAKVTANRTQVKTFFTERFHQSLVVFYF